MNTAPDPRPRTAVQLQLCGMGDLVWHAEYFRCVAEQSEGGQVSVIAAPSAMARELIGHEPWVREIIDFDRRPRQDQRRTGKHSGLGGLMRFGAELAPKQLDRMVLFSDHPGRAVIAAWRAGIPKRIGFGGNWIQRLMLTKTPWIEMYEGPDVAGYIDATNFSLAQGFAKAPIVPRISVRPDALARMQERLAHLPRPLHAFSIGASEPFKQWGAENFAALATQLLQAGHGVLVLGGPGETAVAEAIVAGVAPELRAGLLAITKGTVAETVAALSIADQNIGNDTGGVQMSAAVGTPTWVLLGPRPPLTHDPEKLKLLQAPSLADIRPAEVASVLLGA